MRQRRLTRWSGRTRRLGTAGLCLAVLLSSGMSVGSAASARNATGSPVRGGTLIMARSADIFTFDPYNTQDDNSIFTELAIYDRLVKLGSNGKSILPELATKWAVAKDGKTATFTLRSGVTFSNGTPLTSQDVAWSLQRDADPKGSWGFLFTPVSKVTAAGPHTVVIHMKTPFAPLLPALTTFAASIYSKANYTKNPKTFGTRPLGTGAFMLKKWNKGVSLDLVRNPHYWVKGRPYLDGVRFTVVGDDNSKILQLESNQVQVIDKVPPNLLSSLKRNPKVKIETVNGTAVGWITINEAVKPLNDRKVRLALAWALDRAAIAKNVYFGVATPAKSVVPASTLFYNPNTGPVSYNLAKAKQYLSQSSVPKGFKVQIMIPAGSAEAQGIATIWVDSLKKIGINATIQQLEATTAQDRYNSEKYQIWISEWTNDTPDPDEFAGAGLDYKAGQNSLHTGFKNNQVSNLVNQGRATLNTAKRARIYAEIQRLENYWMPFIYVDNVPRLYASTTAVQGFQPNSQGNYGFDSVWLQH
jgi:peptide/nickel transport system substrate-binding protein